MFVKPQGLVLVVDVDEVLRSTEQPVCDIYNEEHQTNIKPSDIKHWNLSRTFPQIKNTEEFYRKNAERIFYESQPKDDAVSVINDLCKRNTIVFASSQYHGLERLTTQWIHKHEFKYHALFFSFQKNLMNGDIMLDDATHNLSNTRCQMAVCMSKGYNQDFLGYRVQNMLEFHDLVLRKERKQCVEKYFFGVQIN